MKTFKLEDYIRPFDGDFKIPINDNFGEDMEFKNKEKRTVISYIIRRKGYREVKLEITSYLGSIGAVHYYGTIIDNSINFTYPEDKGKGHSIGGYATSGIPRKYTDFKIELFRPVDERDIQNDENWGRESFMRVKPGELTRGFWTEEDAIETGKQVFKAIFKGKWKLIIDSYRGNKDEEIIL